jgi:hypothetical protein
MATRQGDKTMERNANAITISFMTCSSFRKRRFAELPVLSCWEELAGA